MTTSNTGVIYIATGERYLFEAEASIRSLRSTMPSVPITIVTDIEKPIEGVDLKIVEDAEYGFIDKVKYMSKSPYSKTLFLDTDTIVVGDFSELFNLLNHFDICATHAPYRITTELPEVPIAFPELNTGVLAYRDTPQVKELFSCWETSHRKHMEEGTSSWYPIKKRHIKSSDQVSFRECIYAMDSVRIATLTPEYNCRFNAPGFLHTNAKILHGRANLISEIVGRVNKEELPRVHLMRSSGFRMYSDPRVRSGTQEFLLKILRLCRIDYFIRKLRVFLAGG